jgi:hypothetical protein
MTCRACGGPGYQPFAGVSAVSFWIRPNSNSSDPYFSSTPSGQVPPIKLFVLQDGSWGDAGKRYCGNEVYLNTTVREGLRYVCSRSPVCLMRLGSWWLPYTSSCHTRGLLWHVLLLVKPSHRPLNGTALPSHYSAQPPRAA